MKVSPSTPGFVSDESARSRPLRTITVGATSDARWRNIPKRTRTIDRARAHELQQRARTRTR